MLYLFLVIFHLQSFSGTRADRPANFLIVPEVFMKIWLDMRDSRTANMKLSLVVVAAMLGCIELVASWLLSSVIFGYTSFSTVFLTALILDILLLIFVFVSHVLNEILAQAVTNRQCECLDDLDVDLPHGRPSTCMCCCAGCMIATALTKRGLKKCLKYCKKFRKACCAPTEEEEEEDDEVMGEVVKPKQHSNKKKAQSATEDSSEVELETVTIDPSVELKPIESPKPQEPKKSAIVTIHSGSKPAYAVVESST